MKGAGITAWLFYVVVRTLLAVMQAFPIDWNLRTARWVGRIWMRVLPRHRDRALNHLSGAYGSVKSQEELERIADESFASTAMFAVESACLPKLITPFTWSKYFDLVNHRELVDLLIDGRGVILVTGHYGSFELSAHLLAAMGFPMAAVMRPLDNFYLNRYLVGARGCHGMVLIDKKGAATPTEAMLSEGRAVAFVGDQDAGRKGMFVEFFGSPASTYKSIGLLAMATGCPIVVGYTRRHGDRPRYDLGVQRVIRPDDWAGQDDPLRWITQSYTQAIEEIVDAEPGQYLWMHRRWKSQPRADRQKVTEAFGR